MQRSTGKSRLCAISLFTQETFVRILGNKTLPLEFLSLDEIEHLANQHAVAVAIKSVPGVNRVTIGGQDLFPSGERTDERQKRR